MRIFVSNKTTKYKIMTTFEYKYRSYKKGEEVFQLGANGENTKFLGLVSRQTKYSFFYIDAETGRERSKYREITNYADKYSFAKK